MGAFCLPERAAKPEIAIADRVSDCAVQRDPVRDAGARRRSLEAGRERDQLVDEVAAGAPAHHCQPIRIGDAHRDHPIDAGQHVEMAVLEVAADRLAIKRIAVP